MYSMTSCNIIKVIFRHCQSLKRLRADFNDADERGISGARRFLNGPTFCCLSPTNHFLKPGNIKSFGNLTIRLLDYSCSSICCCCGGGSSNVVCYIHCYAVLLIMYIYILFIQIFLYRIITSFIVCVLVVVISKLVV